MHRCIEKLISENWFHLGEINTGNWVSLEWYSGNGFRDNLVKPYLDVQNWKKKYKHLCAVTLPFIRISPPSRNQFQINRRFLQ